MANVIPAAKTKPMDGLEVSVKHVPLAKCVFFFKLKVCIGRFLKVFFVLFVVFLILFSLFICRFFESFSFFFFKFLDCLCLFLGFSLVFECVLVLAFPFFGLLDRSF